MATQEFELALWGAQKLNRWRQPVPMYAYVPQNLQTPARVLDAQSSWKGLELVLADIVERFNVGRERALEFGVEFGFSTVALSSFFHKVVGVDTFQGDRHTANIRDYYAETVERLRPYDNIQVVRSDYRDFIRANQDRYDLIHVDIIHTYSDTYTCGLWSARHSECTIFHDTESFPAVKQALVDIARKTGKTFYNYPEHYGLGILV
jgi:hypothetical protein